MYVKLNQLFELLILVVAIGQPYLREVAQEATITITVKRNRGAKNLFFMFGYFAVKTNKEDNYFAKIDFEQPILFTAVFCGRIFVLRR